MDFPTALLRDLLQLSSSVGLPEDALGATLSELVSDVRAAVPSFRGLDLTIVDNDYPVHIAVFLALHDGESVATSLRMPFTPLGAGLDNGSEIIFYAAAPGAFVDLAADCGYALGGTTSTDRWSRVDGHKDQGRRHGNAQIVLDADLPPRTLRSGLTGLQELGTINRAVGFLIDQGHHPDDAHATLRRHAAAADLAPHVYAARLMQG